MTRRLMTMLVGATLAAAPVDRVFADDNFYSLQKEIALGRQLAREVERQATMVRDPAIAAYLNRIGANLARQSDAQLPVTIQVIDGGDVNAFALPGGFIFVDSGLILKADDEAELAGVIAHCVGHVAARHGTREATESEIAQIGMIPLWFVSGWNAYSAYQAANVLIPMSFLQYSRAFVSEADLLGLDYMYKAGYDPTAFVEMLEKVQAMEKKKAGTAAVVYSTHPPTDERIAAAEEHIRQSLKPRPESIVNTSEFDEVRTRLAMQAPKSRASVASAEGHPPTLHRGPGD